MTVSRAASSKQFPTALHYYCRELISSDNFKVIELKNTHFLTLGGRGDFLLKLLVDAADLSRPFAAFLLSAVSILNTICYKTASI